MDLWFRKIKNHLYRVFVFLHVNVLLYKREKGNGFHDVRICARQTDQIDGCRLPVARFKSGYSRQTENMPFGLANWKIDKHTWPDKIFTFRAVCGLDSLLFADAENAQFSL